MVGNVIFENKINFSSSNTKITPDIEVQFKKSKHVDDVVVHNPGCIRYSSSSIIWKRKIVPKCVVGSYYKYICDDCQHGKAAQ